MITFAKFNTPIHKLLESEGIKLGLVTTNILGALRRACRHRWSLGSAMGPS